MTLNLIWAQTINGVIGDQGSLPWGNLPEDMRHFKELTMGAPIIMGSKTWDSLPERYKPLPGRRNIVLTSRPNRYRNIESYPNLDMVLAATASAPTVWVIGGGQVYLQTLPYADELHVTCIDINVAGDTQAPHVDATVWREDPTRSTTWQTSNTDMRYRYITYIKQSVK